MRMRPGTLNLPGMPVPGGTPAHSIDGDVHPLPFFHRAMGTSEGDCLEPSGGNAAPASAPFGAPNAAYGVPNAPFGSSSAAYGASGYAPTPPVLGAQYQGRSGGNVGMLASAVWLARWC